jgi:putative lipoprotein
LRLSLSPTGLRRLALPQPGSRLLGAALLPVLISAQVSPAGTGRLEGQAQLSPPFPLPADALLDVQLLEINPIDGSTLLRGRSRLIPTGRSPFSFTVRYLDAARRPGSRYQLRATIHQADRLLFRTDPALPPLTNLQSPQQLHLLPVGDAPLRGLQWLRAPAASVPVPPDAPRQEQQFRLDPLNRELIGSGDCNRFIGSYTLQGDRLRLEPAGGTRLDCEPEVIADEQRFLADLLRVRRWRLDPKGRLELGDESGNAVLLMETRPN